MADVNDESLPRLDDTRINQLAALIDGLLTEGSPRLAAPIRFSRRKVKNVELRVKKRAKDTEKDAQSDFMDDLNQT